MENVQLLFVVIAGFILVALASKEIGYFFKKIKLPLISGFLFTGIIAGPFILGFLSLESTKTLIFLEEIALAFIAFAAGSELYWKELRHRLHSITWVTTGLVSFTFTLGTLAVFLLADFIPFMQPMSTTNRVAVSILAASILVARSPSGAIAVINELRARGPFTQIALGVTVIMDVLVITIFAINTSIADALLTNLDFSLFFIALLVVELVASVVIGYIVAKLLQLIVSYNIGVIKIVLILLLGYIIFWVSEQIRHFSHDYFPFEFLLEPLLICMVAGFVLANYSNCRNEFSKLLHDNSLPIYIAFFTITGASLQLDVLITIWPIALILFFVRLGAIYLGSLTGGIMAKEPMRHNQIRWMAFITQAGVGLGLAQTVSVTFPEWGQAFATMMIAVIVLNEIVGPFLFKWVINLVGESHLRAETPEFDGVHDVIIFGLEGQSLALAYELNSHGWQVKIASWKKGDYLRGAVTPGIEVFSITDITVDILRELGADKAEAIVTLLPDEANYLLCELIYAEFGTKDVVVRLNDRANFHYFHGLGAVVVNPATAIVSLFDHLVRSPVATSLLLGMEDSQDIIDIEVRDPALADIALRDLRLPDDVLILSIKRAGEVLISHGYTRLKVGDEVTVVGSLKSLDEISLRFGD